MRPLTSGASGVDAELSPPPRWARWCAWLVPLAILPSAVWRASLLFGHGHLGQNVLDGGWYLILLSVLSVGLGLLTLGLVQPWGTVLPGWIPGWGRRVVPARVAVGAACAGAVSVMTLQLYGVLNHALGLFHPRPLVTTGFLSRQQAPGADVLAFYLPLVLWGPLLLVVAVNYSHRRRRAAGTGRR